MPTNSSNIGAYTHSASPQAVKPGQKKYRENDPIAPLSLMSDPRVVRGSTTNLVKGIINQGKEKNPVLRLKKDDDNNNSMPPSSRPTYTFNVPGFTADEIDLDRYLTDGIDPEQKYLKQVMNSTQTDEFKEKPPTPPYVPRKTGIDGSTQVEDVTELFDFDVEVTPLLEVIVAKTLEQALFELNAEEELKRIENDIGVFNDKREKDVEEMKVLEKKTRESLKSKEIKLKEQRKRKNNENNFRSRAAGAEMIRQLLPSIQNEIMSEFIESGTWADPNVEAIKGEVSDTIEKVKQQSDLLDTARNMIDEMLEAAQTMYHDKQPEPIIKPIPTVAITIFVVKEKIGDEATEDVSVELEIGATDTILDLESRLRSGLTEKSVPLSDISTNLSGFINMAINRNVSRDAYLINFASYLPPNLHIVLD